MDLRVLALTAACTAAYAPAHAGELPLQNVAQDSRPAVITFHDGVVTVIAENATVAELLAEWTRAGGSTFVNAAKIPVAERLTLRLEGKPELEALETILRSVAGYAVVPRAAGEPTVSTLARVYVMAARRPAVITYSAPSLATPNQAAAFGGSDPRPSWPAAGPPRPDDDGPVLNQTGGSVPPGAGLPVSGMPMVPQDGGQPVSDVPAGQVIPGFGATSVRPGVPIGGPARAVATPRRPGGG